MEKTKIDPMNKVKVVTVRGVFEFKNLEEAKKQFPELDPEVNGPKFTWGMIDGDWTRFEDWETERRMSI